jgi:heme a synthase
MLQEISDNRQKIISIWLLLCCLMVVMMVVVGGYTRLSQSGLSIVDWRPITGALPPLIEADWQAEFEKYQQSPEFIKKNFHFSLAEFKQIFLVEYYHRLLGRIAGIVFFIPFLFFTLKKWLPRKLVFYLAGVFLIGGLQGLIGWLMVKSGLNDNPHVSPYKLVMHLLTALVIFSLLWRKFLEVITSACHSERSEESKILHYAQNDKIGGYRKLNTIFLTFLFIQIAYGGFVAGLHAGLVYNTFPLMNGNYLPENMWFMKPAIINIFENHGTVQWIHRVNAIILLFIAFISEMCLLKSTNLKLKLGTMLLVGLVLLQIILGAYTLINQVPILAGLFHQLMAVIILANALYLRHFARD